MAQKKKREDTMVRMKIAARAKFKVEAAKQGITLVEYFTKLADTIK